MTPTRTVSALYRSPSTGVVFRAPDGSLYRAPDDWVPIAAMPEDAARLVPDELGLLEDNEALGEALAEIGMAVGLPRPGVGCTWGRREILDRIAGMSADLLAAESQAMGLYDEL